MLPVSYRGSLWNKAELRQEQSDLSPSRLLSWRWDAEASLGWGVGACFSPFLRALSFPTGRPAFPFCGQSQAQSVDWAEDTEDPRAQPHLNDQPRLGKQHGVSEDWVVARNEILLNVTWKVGTTLRAVFLHKRVKADVSVASTSRGQEVNVFVEVLRVLLNWPFRNG